MIPTPKPVVPLDWDQAATLAIWVRRNAYACLAFGLLLCMTLILMPVAWLLLWQGWVLLQASKALTLASEQRDAEELRKGLRHVGFQFLLQGLFTLAMLILALGLTWAMAHFAPDLASYAASQDWG